MARGAARSEGGPPRIVNVYLDPPTGRVLEVVDFRSSLFGWLHRFHENLTIPEYSGRAIVGWVGVGMLIMSLTGIWLWWPRNGAFLPGLRWGRAPYTTSQPASSPWFLDLDSAGGGVVDRRLSRLPAECALGDGIGRADESADAAAQFRRRRFATRGLRRTARCRPRRRSQAGARPAVIFLPTAGGSSGQRGRARGEATNPGEGAGPFWRVQLTTPGNDLITLTVNDRTGAVARMPDPLAGDRAAQWIRRIHEGSRGGPVWQVIVFLTGVFPAIFAVTGIVMWWRGRRSRKAVAITQGKLQAAE